MTFWSISFALVSLATYLFAPEMLLQSAWIGLASGAVSAAALLPSFKLDSFKLDRVNSVTNPEDLGDRQMREANAYTVSIFGAMAIRVTGTVALFLLCRYQMGLPLPMIALLVCGWYVLLTSVEVSLLARSTETLSAKTLTTGTLGMQTPTTSTELK